MKRDHTDACRAWQLLVRFFFLQRDHLPSGEGEAAPGLSSLQCHVLHLIEPGRETSMGRLADTLSCDASNVTGLVDRLEARGLVRRRPSAEDRRVKVLDLTPAGSKVRTRLLARMTAHPLPLSRLSQAEQRTLVRLLEILLEDQSR